MSEKADPVPMKRFWFTTWRENVLFHADPHCPPIENNVTHFRNPDQLPIAHIPLDIYEKGTPAEINFCEQCVPEDTFEYHRGEPVQ